MVSVRQNLSAFPQPPPADEVVDRKIDGGPLYAAADVRVLLARGENAITAWTRKCVVDLEKLALDLSDALVLIEDALDQGRYHSSEWCAQKPNGPWAACDAYVLRRSEWISAAHKEMQVEYYIKFAIGKTGKLLLLVSCHPPQDRGSS